MSIAPEFLPNNEAAEPPPQDDNGPFSGLGLGAPELYPDFGRWEREFRLPGDMYPENEKEYADLLSWAQQAFIAAESARKDHDTKWQRFFRLYRSHVERTPGDWHSTVFIPMCFWVVETIAPRLVAELPKFTAYPVGPEDVEPAKAMERLLEHSVASSGLYVELVAAFKSALKYGTGILKTHYRRDMRRARRMMPHEEVLRQTIDVPVGEDYYGNPIVEQQEVEVGRVQMGMRSQVYQYVAYEGPAAECIDIFNFWPAPESHDIQSARYVVHRTYKQVSYIQRKVDEGIYRWPSNMGPDEITDLSDQPHLERLNSIGFGSGGKNVDPTYRPVELLEFWLDDGRVITMANRKAILRVQMNPFDHSEKPFVRVVDYYQEHEFWGVGEIEPLEGLQDSENAIWNSRIDNLRLIINSMFYVNPAYVEDMRDFEMRPGGLIRGKGDYKPEEVFSRIDLGDVTQTAFTETEMIERTAEKVSGVSGYQMGLDSESVSDTATGIAIVSEQGASRFGMKNKMFELMGLAPLGRQFASLIQQFTTEEKQVRFLGPQGQAIFESFAPDSIQGAIDIDIQAESTTQTQTMRIEQKQNLLGLVAQFAPQGINKALLDLLDSMGIRDKEAYVYGDPSDPMSQMMMQQQMMALGGGMPGMEGGAPPPEGMDPSMGALPPPGMDPSQTPPYPGMDPYANMNPGAGTQGDMMGDRMMQMAEEQFYQ